MKKIVSVLVCLCLALISSAQWNLVSPYPSVGSLFGSIFFINEDEGWMYMNGLFHTTDAGTTWEKQLTPCSDTDFNALFFINAEMGWLAGTCSIQKTTNGGVSWQQTFWSENTRINSIYFTDELHGWAVGQSWDSHFGWTWGEIFITQDGGNTWDRKKTDRGDMEGNNTDVFFSDADHGWITGTHQQNGILMRTVNGGTTWTNISIPQWVTDVYFTDSLNGWMISNTKIVHSADGGLTWTEQTPAGISGFRDLAFSSAEKGIISGDWGLLLKTTNSGQNWQVEYLTSPEFPYDDQGIISMPDTANFWIVGRNCSIYHSGDGAETWQLITRKLVDRYLQDLYFADEFNGWMVGNLGTYISTTDGGINWEYRFLGPESLLDICFTDFIHGWIVGGGGTILHTSDGGNEWNLQESGTTSGLFTVSFIDESLGWTGGDSAYIFHTENGGQTWLSQDCGIPHINDNDVWSIFFTDANNGWAVIQANPCRIIHSDDGGQNWTTQFSSNYGRLNDIFFIDSLNGWAAGSFVKHTHDGGATWQEQIPYGSDEYNDIFFIDQDFGWVTPETKYTTDGGQSWQSYSCQALFDPNLTNIFFTDPMNGWAIYYDEILHTETGGFVGLPEKRLPPGHQHAAYPNPFTDKVNISFSVDKPGKVVIEVYDMFGKKIFQLLNQDMVSGEYEKKWETTALPAGLYIYRIKAPDYISSGKIIKL